VTQSLAPDVAGCHEQGLFDRYIGGLRAFGVRDDAGLRWYSYRNCLVLLVTMSPDK
jgi:hypothetical protein